MLIVAGCSGRSERLQPMPTVGPGHSGTASPIPSPRRPPSTAAPPTAPLTLVELRYLLVEGPGRPLFCDPDLYPVARNDEATLARERFPSIRADSTTFSAIAAHVTLNPAAPSAAEVLAVYREWKMLNALVLTPQGAAYQFDYIAAAGPGARDGWHVAGRIDAFGSVRIERRDPSGPPPCPICLARGTRIATPQGPVAIENMRPGMSVWTTDGSGFRVAGRVLVVGSTPIPPTHRVVHLVLADGRTVDASPGHPLPDGRRLGDLRPGSVVDGADVVSADLVPYGGGATFDLLPSGPKGAYWADGILLGSTLAVTFAIGR